MKLELGKRYRTRNGKETSPLEWMNSDGYMFTAKIDKCWFVWTKEGMFNQSESGFDLVEEIEEKQEPRIDYDKMYEDLEKNHSSFTYAWNESKYTKTEQEDGTVILKPKKPKKRKVWIEVYEYDGKIEATAHTTKDSLDESLKFGQGNGETLLEVIEREYPINKEKC